MAAARGSRARSPVPKARTDESFEKSSFLSLQFNFDSSSFFLGKVDCLLRDCVCWKQPSRGTKRVVSDTPNLHANHILQTKLSSLALHMQVGLFNNANLPFTEIFRLAFRGRMLNIHDVLSHFLLCDSSTPKSLRLSSRVSFLYRDFEVNELRHF
jgi:hypothetical protein